MLESHWSSRPLEPNTGPRPAVLQYPIYTDWPIISRVSIPRKLIIQEDQSFRNFIMTMSLSPALTLQTVCTVGQDVIPADNKQPRPSCYDTLPTQCAQTVCSNHSTLNHKVLKFSTKSTQLLHARTCTPTHSWLRKNQSHPEHSYYRNHKSVKWMLSKINAI